MPMPASTTARCSLGGRIGRAMTAAALQRRITTTPTRKQGVCAQFLGGHPPPTLDRAFWEEDKSWRTCAPIGVVLFMTREKTILTMLVACLIWMWATTSRLLRRCHWGFNQGKCRINEMTVLPLSLSIHSLPRVHDTTALLCVPWQLYCRGNVCLQDIRLAVEGNGLRGIILTIEGQSLQS
jgi:hypothetical protein